MPHTIEDYRIAGSLINAFHDRLISDKQDWKQIVVNMKRLVNTENVLKSLYEEEKLKLKSKYDKLYASEVNDFPKLELDAIKTHITLGSSYQITQTKSYIGEHLDENGDYLIMVEKQKLSLDNDNVISLFILLNCLILINIMFILLEFSIIVWPNSITPR